jgi:hypothetical protein
MGEPSTGTSPSTSPDTVQDTAKNTAPASASTATTAAPADGDNSGRKQRRQRGRSKGRALLCPVHPDTPIAGNGRKYYLHLLQPEELRQRGMSDKRARLVIQAHPVLVLSNEWLEELFCPECGSSRWCHVVRHDKVRHDVRWAPRDLWQQVAHVDPLVPNPSVSQFSRRSARRAALRRADGKRYFERS